jgi:tetratricopeptide (TPR) repeat protein
LRVESDGKARIFVSAPSVRADFEELNSAPEKASIQKLDVSIFAAYSPTFSEEFAEWLDSQKVKIESVVQRVLIDRLQATRASGRWEELERNARTLLIHSPHNEEATLALAESLALRGDKVEGVKVLDRYLTDIGGAHADLRLSATTMRKRIADRMPQPLTKASVDAPMLGRERSMQQLAALMTSARNHSPQACRIVGDPGIGKSRLIEEFLRFAALQGFACHRVFCRSSDANRALAVILDMIPLLRSMRGSIGSSPDTISFLDALSTHRPNRETKRGAIGAAGYVGTQLDIALSDIIDAVTEESPLVFVIEDCQWIDELSASVIMRVIDRLKDQRIVFLITTRQAEPAWCAGSSAVIHDVQLVPLSLVSSSEIVLTIAKQHGVKMTDSHLAWIVRVAEGNPFFLHELATHWIESRTEHTVPASLTAVLKQRLTRLGPRPLQVLQTCAILENHSTADNIEAVLGCAAHELLSSINELVAAGMIALDESDAPSPSVSRISSKHDLLSETALRLLASPARSYLHRRAAKVLESRIEFTGDASTLWSCAKHWQLAGDHSQAFRLANSCARHLLEAELPSEAADAYTKAVEYCATDIDRLTIIEGQATAYYRCSNWDSVIELSRQARSMKERLFPERSKHDELELMLRRAEWQNKDWNHILVDSLTCLAATEATAAHRLEAGVMALMILTPQGDKTSAEQTYQSMMDLSGESDAPQDLTLQANMIFNTAWGSIDEAVTAAQKLVAEQRKKHDIGELFRAHCNAGVTFRVAGQFDCAIDQFHLALNLADRHGIERAKTRAIPMLAHLYIEQGNLEAARHCRDALRNCARGSYDRATQIEIRAIEARLALWDDPNADVLSLIENDLAEMRGDQLPHRRAYWKALRVGAQLAKYGTATADSIGELEDEHLKTRRNVFQAFTTFALYAGLLSVGEQNKAERYLSEYTSIYRREPWPPSRHLLTPLLQFVEQKRPRPIRGLVSNGSEVS